jgi:hypothetical protein
LGDYVQVLFQLTVGAIKTDNEEVSHYAIEFWNTLCDAEIAISQEVQQAEGKHFNLCSIFTILSIF